MSVSEERIASLKKFKAQMDNLNDFEILNLSQDCNDSATRAAYFAALKKYGADFFYGVDAETMQDVTLVNKRLRDAYTNLQTEEKREAMRERLKNNTTPGAPQSDAPESTLDVAAVFEVDQALSRASAFMERGNHQMAYNYLQKAHQKDPQNFEIEVRLAISEFILLTPDEKGHRSAQKLAHVRSLLENAATQWPQADYIPFYQGEIENLEDNTEKALEFYKRAVKLSNSPAAQREIYMIESRMEAKKIEAEQPKNLLDRIKATFKKLSEIKL